ncbi:uncharacterized protein [Pyrus communis]|uniref:uncharacterized protein n=1 Tax=Pyrus communis TaxID=23211 RepID=UPI0035BF8813
MRDLKLQMTLSNFEDLRMLEFETFSVFFEKIEMLTNEALGLGKPIDETIVVQKILRYLPKRFHAKKAVIQEFKDLNEIKLEKLVGKLITYEMKLDIDESDSKKSKRVAL